MAPDGWRWCTIGELGHGSVDVVQTGPFGAQLHSNDYVPEGIPFVLIKNMTDAGIDATGMPRISLNDARRLARYSLRPGDVVFSRVGRVGSCFLATIDHEGWIISGQLLRIRLPSTAIYPPFLVCALRGDSAQDFINGSAVGSTRKSINTRILSSLRVPVPPLPEQRKIAAIVSSVDDTIEKTQAVIDQMQVVKRGLMQELLTQGLPGQHTRFKQTELGEIPEDWSLATLSQVADVRRGASPRPIRNSKWFSNKGRGWVRITDVTRSDRFLRKTDQTLSQLGESRSVPVDPGDLVMSICATIGKPIIIGIPACIHDGFVVFKNLRRKVLRDFLY